jgi:hypothetical protein
MYLCKYRLIKYYQSIDVTFLSLARLLRKEGIRIAYISAVDLHLVHKYQGILTRMSPF